MSTPLSKSFLLVLFAATASFGALAADDPGIHEVYEAANNGHLDQARSMMAQVLKDHPDSAKAHYVAAEIDARGGDFGSARSEFQTAEKLAPGLPFAKPYSVQELRGELYSPQAAQPPRVITPGAPLQRVQQSFQQPGPMHSGFPWGGIIGIAFVVWIVWMIFRRFVGPRPMYGVGGVGGPGGYGPGGGYYGGGYPPPAGGGLLGSLGTGMAVGAGVVAGEEIAHHLLDGNGRVIERDVVQSDDPGAQQNSDMGGSDFGVSDNSSWDNGGGGGDSSGGIDGGGGDSWS
jgi:uncharacterized protein